MSKQVRVTGAQKDAAKMIIERSTAKGKPVSASVRKIASAPLKTIRVTRTSKDELPRSTMRTTPREKGEFVEVDVVEELTGGGKVLRIPKSYFKGKRIAVRRRLSQK